MENQLFELSAPSVIDNEFAEAGKITLLNKAHDMVFNVTDGSVEGTLHTTLSFFLHRMILLPASFFLRKDMFGILESFAKKVKGGEHSHLVTESFTERVLGMADDITFLIKDETYQSTQIHAELRTPQLDDADYGTLIGVTLTIRQGLTLEEFHENLAKIRAGVHENLQVQDEVLSQNGGDLLSRYKSMVAEEELPDPPVGGRIAAIRDAVEAHNASVDKPQDKVLVDRSEPGPMLDAIKIKATGEVCAMKGGKEVETRANLPRVGWNMEEFVDQETGVAEDFDWICFTIYMRMHSGSNYLREMLQARFKKEGADVEKILDWEKRFNAADQEIRDRLLKKKK